MSGHYILIAIKADWAEVCSRRGMPTWSSANHPCVFCGCTSDNVDNSDHICLTDLPWGPERRTYREERRRSETHVTNNDEKHRRMILELGGLRADPKNERMGRYVVNEIPRMGLKPNDRLEPSLSLPDTSRFEAAALPCIVVFWRAVYDARGRIDQSTPRSNPIFSREVGIDPQSGLHIDTLHTLYLGTM